MTTSVASQGTGLAMDFFVWLGSAIRSRKSRLWNETWLDLWGYGGLPFIIQRASTIAEGIDWFWPNTKVNGRSDGTMGSVRRFRPF